MMAKTLERINQSVWEIRERVLLNPGNFEYRMELLNFWIESKIFIERRGGVPEPQRSFLMLQKPAFSSTAQAALRRRCGLWPSIFSGRDSRSSG